MYPMRALARFVQAGFVMAAGCLLGACQTVERPNYNEADLQYVPAPRSTLVGRQDLQFLLAQAQRGEVMMTVLAYQAPGGKPSPVALMASSWSGNEPHVSIQRMPLVATTNERGDLSVATLEYLYTLVLRQEAEARFCFADIGRRCDAGRKGYSHAGVLLQLARARHEAVGLAAGKAATIPWHEISLTAENAHHTDPDDVGARIAGGHGPIVGATIFFNRAPHSSCAAKSRDGGLATCHLIDQHGDEDTHSEQDKTPVLAIFPGDVRADRVLLPTTLMQHPLARP
jgi:hypothetical protein